MKMTGAQILCECLVREGVDVIFGILGGAILPLYDTLPQFPQLRHILVRHEQGAAHAADGYARTTGKVGVCFATSGPGATNLVTGIANAYLDSSPMVAITGQVARPFIGKDAFQEVDITGKTIWFLKPGQLPKQLKKHFTWPEREDPGQYSSTCPKTFLVKKRSFITPIRWRYAVISQHYRDIQHSLRKPPD